MAGHASRADDAGGVGGATGVLTSAPCGSLLKWVDGRAFQNVAASAAELADNRRWEMSEANPAGIKMPWNVVTAMVTTRVIPGLGDDVNGESWREHGHELTQELVRRGVS